MKSQKQAYNKQNTYLKGRMDKNVINGGKPLNGEVFISGAKNAVLHIMTACMIEPGKYTLNNVPDLRDTRTMGRLIEMIGLLLSCRKFFQLPV